MDKLRCVAADAIPGNYVIKATSVIDETKSDTATITVKLPDGVNSITISPKTSTVFLGEAQQFQVTVDVIGEVDNSVNWTCYDETGKVTVDNNGLVSVAADAIPGNYIIKATSLADESMSDTATVTVKEIPSITSVSVNPKTSTIVKGGAQQLQAVVTVIGDADKTVIWSTNDETGKVSVDGNGQVSVASDATVGDYFIKATSLTDESKFDTATLQLQAEVIAKGDADKGVTWSTYDETGKVTVNDNGKVSVASDAVIGEYIIKATSVFDSLKYDTAKIIVKIADTNIENPIPNTPEEEVEEKTVTVVEVPEGISNPNKIQVISGGDVFNKSVEVRLKKDEAVEVMVREKLQQIDIMKDAEVIIFPMDISIYEKGTEIKVQPKEGTTVDIIVPIPDELQTYKDKLKVLCIIDNKLYVLPSMLVTEEGVKCVQFTAKHFSPYSFIVDLYGTLDGYVSEEDNSNNGDDSSTEITPTPVDNTETEEIDGNIPEDNGSTSGENPTKDSSSLEDGDLTNNEDNKGEDGNSDQNNDSNNENKGNNDVLNENSSDSSDTAIPKTGEQILIMVILGIAAGGCIVFRYFIKNTKYNN
ncbi:MAG: cell wall/surface repeat protein [Herbinix sp.]|nr:cell wall/surface repeat protein [Herbinix sp.]